jgi:hypothetical protein
LNAWPNSYPTLEPGSHRWCEKPNSAPREECCSWSTPAFSQGRIPAWNRGALNPASKRWQMNLHVCRCCDLQLTYATGSPAGLNSGEPWRLNLQPQPNRRTS